MRQISFKPSSAECEQVEISRIQNAWNSLVWLRWWTHSYGGRSVWSDCPWVIYLSIYFWWLNSDSDGQDSPEGSSDSEDNANDSDEDESNAEDDQLDGGHSGAEEEIEGDFE